jgi:FkbM family methyltransferase
MFVDCVEIGSCDFDVAVLRHDVRTGLCIEPIPFYLDRLPNKQGIKKINRAVSDENGKCTIYFVDPEIIETFHFPDWFRGCNSINAHHPTVDRVIRERGLDPDDYISQYIVEKKTLFQLLEEEGVLQMYLLKIDTEGHDCAILGKYLQDIADNSHKLPFQLFFECNILTEENALNNMLNLLTERGYDLITKDDSDAYLKLNLQKVRNKTRFSQKMDNYYVMDYLPGYNPEQPGHDNTLISAMKYCVDNGGTGVTWENGRFQVRGGPYLCFFDDGRNDLKSWVYL